MRTLYGIGQSHQLGLPVKRADESKATFPPDWKSKLRRQLLEGIHAQGHVHAGAVGQEGSQRRFLNQADDQHNVPAAVGRRAATSDEKSK